MSSGRSADARNAPGLSRLALPVLLIVAAVAASVTHLVSQHTIDVVRTRRLLPKWDLATHLGHGWLDCHLLVTGRIHLFLWDLWKQGYWPPGLSIFQLPFYFVLGGDMTSGLWSSMVAFVLVAVIGAAVLLKQQGGSALLAVSVFVALLISSPFLLAYASVAMTEMLGAVAQLLVLFCYVGWRQHPSRRHARFFAVSLTVLFFVKYNYFVMLGVPLVLYEWLEHTSGWSGPRRFASLWSYSRRILSSPTGLFIALYLAGFVLIIVMGGFEFQLLGQRVSVRSIGNSGHLVLYVVLLRLWYLHRRGRIDWQHLLSRDTRARPLLLWFVLPVTVWLASPYPNHIRDFANLVINRAHDDLTVGSGLVAYLNELRSAYFYSEWVLGLVMVAFGMAALRYRVQPPLMRWLILAIPLQFAVVAVHQTRSSRFLLLTVVLLCLAAASEVGRWLSRSSTSRVIAGLIAPIVLVSGFVATRHVVADERFTSTALSHYTDSPPLHAALDKIRAELTASDRLLIVGQNNDLSPALFRWELGPPSGVPCFPFEIGGRGRLDLALATRVLLLVPLHSDAAPLGVASNDPARLRALLDDVERGHLVLRSEFPLPDLHVALRLYTRTLRPPRMVECRS